MMHCIRTLALVPLLSAACSLGAAASPTLPLPPPREPMRFMLPPREALLTVVGEGTVFKAPDEAKISLQIVTDDASATKSVSKNNDIRKALQARLNFLDAVQYDVFRETGYAVEYIPFPPKNMPAEQRQARYGYVTTRSLTVTVLPIDLVGRTIDAATAAGVTSIGDVNFDIKDHRAAYMSALGAAMNDAKQQAQALATAGGFHVTGVRSVTGDDNTAQPPVPMLAAAHMRRIEAAPTPTEVLPGGPIDVNARVTVTYTIK